MQDLGVKSQWEGETGCGPEKYQRRGGGGGGYVMFVCFSLLVFSSPNATYCIGRNFRVEFIFANLANESLNAKIKTCEI